MAINITDYVKNCEKWAEVNMRNKVLRKKNDSSAYKEDKRKRVENARNLHWAINSPGMWEIPPPPNKFVTSFEPHYDSGWSLSSPSRCCRLPKKDKKKTSKSF